MKWLVDLVVSFLLDLWSRWKANEAHTDKGRNEVTARVNEVVAEMADDQARVNAQPRGGARYVAERLRDPTHEV